MRRWLPLIALACAFPAAAQEPPARMETVPLKPDLFMVTGGGGNSVVWVTPHGLILVDDKLGTPGTFEALAAAVAKVSALPVIAVFNTHHHLDHIGNNDRFLAANVPVIAEETLPDRLATERVPQRLPRPAAPDLLYHQDFSLVTGTGRAEAHHFGPGHTGSDSVILFPADKAAAIGGLAVTGAPTIDYEAGANLAGWIATLDRLGAMDLDVIVPGRGPALDRAGLRAFRDKLATFRDRVRASVQRGVPKQGLIASVRTDDLGWTWTAASWPAARLDGLWKEAGGA